jgi:hypothetical protein
MQLHNALLSKKPHLTLATYPYQVQIFSWAIYFKFFTLSSRGSCIWSSHSGEHTTRGMRSVSSLFLITRNFYACIEEFFPFFFFRPVFSSHKLTLAQNMSDVRYLFIWIYFLYSCAGGKRKRNLENLSSKRLPAHSMKHICSQSSGLYP